MLVTVKSVETNGSGVALVMHEFSGEYYVVYSNLLTGSEPRYSGPIRDFHTANRVFETRLADFEGN